MENESKTKRGATVGEMHKRRETMPDGRRYMIYYTFETRNEVGTMNDEIKDEIKKDNSNSSNSSSGVSESSFPENV